MAEGVIMAKKKAKNLALYAWYLFCVSIPLIFGGILIAAWFTLFYSLLAGVYHG